MGGEAPTAGWASATRSGPCRSHPPPRESWKLAAPTVAAASPLPAHLLLGRDGGGGASGPCLACLLLFPPRPFSPPGRPQGARYSGQSGPDAPSAPCRMR